MNVLKYLLHCIFLFFVLIFTVVLLYVLTYPAKAQTTPLEQVFKKASREYNVPTELLKTICYMEGDLSMHNGYPSSDDGFGCMHLVKNNRTDTLDEAASLTSSTTTELKQNITANILGGAALLRRYAIQLSSHHTLPTHLSGWYGAVAAYSNAQTKQSAEMYADEVYTILKRGFSASSDTGEQVTLTPQSVTPDKQTVNALHIHTHFPKGCVADGNTDYPGAIDCLLPPDTYDCNTVPTGSACTYEDANRPTDLPISFITIHDVEGPLSEAFAIFRNPKYLVSIHYIVDTDGTVYQLVPEKDIAYHAGNFWYNQRTIGIEHTSFQASGFTWYSAGEYLGSARLTAYLAKKYAIPLDHDHIISHGTIPAPTLNSSPNHLDPGPYWQWDYYFNLIHQLGVAYPASDTNRHILSIHPQQNTTVFSPNGSVYPPNDNFFYLYTGPGTKYPQIPSSAPISTYSDVTNNIEPDISYYYRNKIADPAGSGTMLYQIWYGENDAITPPSITTVSDAKNNFSVPDIPLMPLIGASSDKPVLSPENWFAHAKLAWVSVPQNAIEKGSGQPVMLTAQNGADPTIYGMPVKNKLYIIGDAPKGSIFVSGFTQTATTNALWYEINYNHRQAWVPSTEIVLR